MIARRSAWTILSISPACVDSRQHPKHRSRALDRHCDGNDEFAFFGAAARQRRAHRQGVHHLGIDGAIAAGSFLVDREIARCSILLSRPLNQSDQLWTSPSTGGKSKRNTLSTGIEEMT